MNRKARDRLLAILDRLDEEMARGGDRSRLIQSIDWQALDRLSDADLAAAVIALGEQFPPLEAQP